jgi:hypothetical protein
MRKDEWKRAEEKEKKAKKVWLCFKTQIAI